MVQKILSLVLAAFIAFGLTACGDDANKAILEARVAAAEASTELSVYKEAKAKELRQAEAGRQVGSVARQVVRTSQLTDMAGCNIAPTALTAAGHFKEFGSSMSSAYPDKCRMEVAAYKAERRSVAAKAVAVAKAKEQQRLAAARSDRQVAAKR